MGLAKMICNFCGHISKDRMARYCSRCGSSSDGSVSRRTTHTKLSDGRVVLRGSKEEAEHKYGDLVKESNERASQV